MQKLVVNHQYLLTIMRKIQERFSMKGGVGITFKNASQVIGELKKLGFN